MYLQKQLDIRIFLLINLDIHGILRVCDIQKIIYTNQMLASIVIRNFEWQNEETIDFSSLDNLRTLKVYTDNHKLKLIIG